MEEYLVRMAKDGATTDVHPSCVADHQRLGWVVSPQAPVAELPPADGAASDELQAARADYEAAIGKRAFHSWDVATLRDKIQAAKAGHQ
jgi:hypothetical protein